MRATHLSRDTPLGQQFNGEWGFWESFFVPLLTEDDSMRALALLDPAACEERFQPQRLPVACHVCPQGQQVLTIPDECVVRYEVKVVCKDLDVWSDLCNKIGEDMLMQDFCIVEHKHLKPGDECVAAFHEKVGTQEHARLTKRDFEQLKLPVVLTFNVSLRPAAEWAPDVISLQYKFDMLAQVYTSNLLGGFSALSGAKADPWSPMARLATNALTRIVARFPEIRTVLDAGCGDMAWMQHFLREHPLISYVGADIMPYCLALNFRRFPQLQFIQTDLSNTTGVEVLPQGVDLILCKDVLNHMVLPDAVAALRRLLETRPRFLLTHVHGACDNTGWEKRIDKHLHYTRYDYNKPPFSLPYPAVDVQRISDEAFFVLYEVSPRGAASPPPFIGRLGLPAPPATMDGSDGAYALLRLGELQASLAAPDWTTFAPPRRADGGCSTDELGPRPISAGLAGTDKSPSAASTSGSADVNERRPVKGIPVVEFRARCDLIFDKFDRDKDQRLDFGELCALMEKGGRNIDSYEAFTGLCSKLGCDARLGLSRKDVYKLFEKAPQEVWEAVYRSINPLAQMVKRGSERLPDTFLERDIPSFLFEDEREAAKVTIELNTHLFYGAAETVTEAHVQAFIGKRRLEVHVVAPGSFGAKDLFLWKLIVTPLSDEVVPEDCTLELKETSGRFGSKRIMVRLMKSKPKKWYKIGQAATGQRV
eukprot:TRINITY_DN21619_c0_g1_i1.p1 TRINITY_DN21619_c0_g1~~TRINITY_DN21619_c0_g1_i1.p1  ORF type:complete len:706 (-),score=143.73 TRINITY_DN21619_c0_g1_i1:225-2342(-)